MPTLRVFVSSVVTGFEAERAAVRAAIESLRHQPVMAEHFGAKPYSSQEACLDEVRNSEVYIGVFGSRYGHVAKSGVSVTEEEFLEARRTGRLILCFIQQIDKEPQQEAFLSALKMYEDGYFIDTFSTPEDLKLKVVRALHDVVEQPGVQLLDLGDARTHLDRHDPVNTRARRSDAWLGVVIFPQRQGETYVSVIDLGRREWRDQVLQRAVFGQAALLNLERGVRHAEGEDHVVFEEGSDYGTGARLVIYSDGTLAYGVQLGQREHRDNSILRIYLIDQDEVQRNLESAVTYAHSLYQGLNRAALGQTFFLGTVFHGIGNKMLGRRPASEPHSVTVPTHRLEDPLHIPPQPLQVTMADLADASRTVENLMSLVARAFRIGGAYYDPR